jgi:hypothetical protein
VSPNEGDFSSEPDELADLRQMLDRVNRLDLTGFKVSMFLVKGHGIEWARSF